MARKKTVESEVKATETAKVEAIEPKAENIKTEETVAEPKAAESKAAEPKKAPAKKAPKNESTKAEKTQSVKKSTGNTPVKKAEAKSTLHIQYGGKSLAEEDLIKSAKDVWKYDLKRKVGDLTSIELYVKPEENKVYYVMNGDCTGSFDI